MENLGDENKTNHQSVLHLTEQDYRASEAQLISFCHILSQVYGLTETSARSAQPLEEFLCWEEGKMRVV